MNYKRLIVKIVLLTLLLLLSYGFAKSVFALDDWSLKYVESVYWLENPDDYKTHECKYPLRKIAKAFAIVESNNCSRWLSLRSKNCWSLHKWWTYNRWDGVSYMRNTEPLRIYTRQTAAAYDFMYLWVKWYWCKVDYNHIKFYICGRADWCRGSSYTYLRNLKKIILNTN